jgi:SagB-type dehydrogenase family enzyme
MSLLIAAQALGLAGGVVAHFSDLGLARTLGLASADEAPLAFLILKAASKAVPIDPRPKKPVEPLPCTPNELSEEEVPYYLLLGMHRSTLLPEPAGAAPKQAEEAKEPKEAEESTDAPLGMVVRRRRSALDFDPQTQPMESAALEQLLDFATRDWPADWRGNFGAAERAAARRGRDFVELYIYAHRISGIEPGVYQWSRLKRQLDPLHLGNVQRMSAYLSLEQPLAGHSCLTISMMADLESAARLYGNRGYRYVPFEAGAIGQRLYLGAEALGWNATGIGAFYDDDVHRYLGFLGEEETSVVESVSAAEETSLVNLDGQRAPEAITISESHEEQRRRSGARRPTGSHRASRDGSQLPRQVIYHFAVGRAVKDPRLEAQEE